jgi:hypothetical protein
MTCLDFFTMRYLFSPEAGSVALSPKKTLLSEVLAKGNIQLFQELKGDGRGRGDSQN